MKEEEKESRYYDTGHLKRQRGTKENQRKRDRDSEKHLEIHVGGLRDLSQPPR